MKSIPFPKHPDGRTLPTTPCVPYPAPAGKRRLWLVRHGEVIESEHGHAYGSRDVPLSERGRARTHELGGEFEQVPLDAVYASDLSRAHELGQAIAKGSGAELVVDARVREIDRGQWQGKTKDFFAAGWSKDVEAFYRDPSGWSAPGGESDRDVWERAHGALDDALERFPAGDIAFAAHNNWIRIVVTRLLGWSAAESFAFKLEPTHLARLETRNGHWQLVEANVSSPLEGCRE